VVFAGTVTQSFITSPGSPYVGAVQNVTDANHLSYPGTISRYVSQNAAGIKIFTHGIGVNKAISCSSPLPLLRQFQTLLGFANDTSGPKAFKQLDKEMIKYYRNNYPGPPTSQAQDPCSDINNCGFAPVP
jgi:hypothetical protein